MMFRDDCRDVPKPCQTSEVVKPSLSLSTPVYCAVSLITNQTSSLVSLYELKAVETSLASKIISSVSPQSATTKQGKWEPNLSMTRLTSVRLASDTTRLSGGWSHTKIRIFRLLLFILLNEDVEVSGHVWELWVIWDWSGYDCGQFRKIRTQREHVEFHSCISVQYLISPPQPSPPVHSPVPVIK